MEGVETTVSTNGLRKMSWEGFIGFSVKAKDTEENAGVHTKFREYAKKQCDGNYTLAIKLLLDYVESDYKYQSLFEQILDLGTELDEIKVKVNEDKKEKDEVKKNAF